MISPYNSGKGGLTGESMQRKLGLVAVLAVVTGDMIGSGIFFTPGQLAAVADANWQVYFFWTLCGFITLCGALTLAEITARLPRSGASWHALREGFGPFPAFMQAWIMILVSGPGAMAGIAILFGEFATRILPSTANFFSPVFWAAGAIVFFVLINLRGVHWGGRTQILLTTVKLAGLCLLVLGGLFIADPVTTDSPDRSLNSYDPAALIRFIGVGVAIVLFTYDGWIDASNIAGEVRSPNRIFPLAMTSGVIVITGIYLLVNVAFLQVVPLEAMKQHPTTVAATVAEAAFGPAGGTLLNGLIWLSVFGALGGVVMTLPRLYFAAASEYREPARDTLIAPVFNLLSRQSPVSGVPSGAVLVAGVTAIAALTFFGSFSRIVTFFVVPFQCINILMVASIFPLRRKASTPDLWKMPFYPLPPLIFILVMSVFLVTTLYHNPLDSLVGLLLTLAGIPAFMALRHAS